MIPYKKNFDRSSAKRPSNLHYSNVLIFIQVKKKKKWKLMESTVKAKFI